MFTTIKNGKEISAAYYFQDAFTLLNKIFNEQRSSKDTSNLLDKTFIKMHWDENEIYDIPIPLAYEIATELKLFVKGKINREKLYQEKDMIMKIMIENNHIKIKKIL